MSQKTKKEFTLPIIWVQVAAAVQALPRWFTFGALAEGVVPVWHDHWLWAWFSGLTFALMIVVEVFGTAYMARGIAVSQKWPRQLTIAMFGAVALFGLIVVGAGTMIEVNLELLSNSNEAYIVWAISAIVIPVCAIIGIELAKPEIEAAERRIKDEQEEKVANTKRKAQELEDARIRSEEERLEQAREKERMRKIREEDRQRDIANQDLAKKVEQATKILNNSIPKKQQTAEMKSLAASGDTESVLSIIASNNHSQASVKYPSNAGQIGSQLNTIQSEKPTVKEAKEIIYQAHLTNPNASGVELAEKIMRTRASVSNYRTELVREGRLMDHGNKKTWTAVTTSENVTKTQTPVNGNQKQGEENVLSALRRTK